MPRHIVIITGSRAEWGLLRPLHDELLRAGLRTTVLVTGSHLHAAGGCQADEIFSVPGITAVPVAITPDDPSLNDQQLMFATMAGALNRLPAVLQQLQPDLVIVLGDRYEIFAAASVCRLSGIRLAHISGGELTLGAFDDALRHCITKLSDLHFTASEDYRRRVIQLGENPQFVYNVGELALDKLSRMPFKSRYELEGQLECRLDDFFLLTVHPETCAPGEGLRIVELLLGVLRAEFPEVFLIFTGANADPEGSRINELLKAAFADGRAGRFFNSLGRLNYLSLARLARCVIGNSSSGIAEVPALGTPVVNIGRRQQGRPHGSAVTSVFASEKELAAALKKAADPGFRVVAAKFVNPYAGEDSAATIAGIIAGLDLSGIPRAKPFHDL